MASDDTSAGRTEDASRPPDLEPRPAYARTPGSGRYRILHKLGAGGMGIVYAAHDPLLDCTVALKQLRPELGSSLIDRLQREARAMARLRAEPHVVTLYDFFSDGEVVFVVMEYVEGATLRAFQDGPRTWRELLDKYLQAGAGLAAAHRAGLVHRDFKPENVLLDSRGIAKVSDFGLAYADASADPLEPSVAGPAHTSPHGGTPRYMSPEQGRGAPLDARSDQFSFCVALYEALFREHPFWPMNRTGASETQDQDSVAATLSRSRPDPLLVLVANIHGELRPPPESAQVPGYVLAALRRGLDKRPAGRFASMEELLAALRAAPNRRGRGLALAGAALAAGALLLSATRDSPAPPVTREALERRAGQALSDELRLTELTDRLRAAAVPGATYVAAELGRYVTRWASRHADQQWELLRRPGDPEATTREQCLAQARRAVTTLVLDLRAAAPAGGRSVVELVDRLPAPEECVTVTRGRLACALELADLAADPRSEPVFAAMREATRLEAAGALPAAIEVAARATELAAGGAPQVIAEAHYLRGRLLYLVDRPEPALADLATARDAVLPTGCIDLQAQAYSRMIKVTALHPSLPDGPVDDWVRVLFELARAAGDGGARLADAYNERGLHRLLRRADPAGALVDLQQAIELRERVLAGRPSVDLADSYLNVGIARGRLGDLVGSRAAFAEAQRLRAAVLGPPGPGAPPVFTSRYKEFFNRGLVALEAGELAAARGDLELALALVDQELGRDDLQAVKILLALAQLHQGAGDLPAARRALAEADARAQAAATEPTQRLEARVSLLGVTALFGDADADARLGAVLAEARADPRVAREALALGDLVRAQIAVGEQRFIDAEAHATAALDALAGGPGARDGTYREALFYRGVAALSRGELARAIADLEALLAAPRGPADAYDLDDARRSLAAALDLRGRADDRRRACEVLAGLAGDAPPEITALARRCASGRRAP